MTPNDLNELSKKMYRGSLSETKMLEYICCYVIRNYPVFGLQKFDEDFRQEVLLNFIEKGHRVLNQFNPDFGDFFTFLYCSICTIINTTVKKEIIHNMKEKINLEESIINFEEKEQKYYRIDFNNFEVPKVPFSNSKIPADEIRKTLKSLSLKHKNKTIIILALKSSYYLTDEQIQRICKISGLKPEYFYSLIQHCKDSLDIKSQRREKAEERRNFAYYHHKRYNKIMQKLDDDLFPDEQNIIKEKYLSMENKHRHNWLRLNNAFEKGHIYLRPTNKTVANLMGICERQVNYYIKCARKEIKKDKYDSPKNDTDCSED